MRYGGDDHAVVKRAVFERLCAPAGDGRFVKRTDLELHYFVLPHNAIIAGAEGNEFAKAGDWVMEGVEGELYPVAKARARRLYETI